MRVLVMGGGKVGSFLARELRATGHAVIVIERNRAHAEEVAEETGALAIEGDGTDLTLLEELEIRSTDLFVAVTGIDEDNLVACQLVRAAYGVHKVLARLNDPRNRATFDALDIPVVSVTDLLAQVISQELEFAELVRVALLARGEVSVYQIDIPESNTSRVVSELKLPDETVFVAVERGDDVFIPSGAFVLTGGDKVTVVSRLDGEDEVRAALVDASVDGPAFEREP
ncbi:MAG: NAD-binding protein [Acidimicrobiia bacterium]|nr:NAD-binding protein [Acidimicrobiia bacterium]